MSLKNVDSHNRWRSKTVAFRMSPEEADQLDVNVKLSGLKKQDYLIHRSLNRDIKVIGNPRVYKALKNQMKEILKELERISESKDISDELFDTIDLIAEILNEMKGESNE